jgi:alpha-beta hydrolase superfamily lysophospholipase
LNSTSGTFPAKDGTPLYWQHWEPDGARRATVCLCHGLGEHVGRYEHVARSFTAAGLSLLGCDLRGHGRSGGPRGHTPTFHQILDDLGTLIERAGQDRPVFLYGHSMGGTIVLHYALDHPSSLAGLVATGPWLRLRQPIPAPRRMLARVMASVYPGFTQASGLNVQGLSRDPEVVRKYVQDPLVHDRITAMLGHSLILAGEAALARGEILQLPILLMHGEDDPLTDPAATQLLYQRVSSRDKTLRIWPGLLHEIHNEPEQSEVIDLMVEWFASRI